MVKDVNFGQLFDILAVDVAEYAESQFWVLAAIDSDLSAASAHRLDFAVNIDQFKLSISLANLFFREICRLLTDFLDLLSFFESK